MAETSIEWTEQTWNPIIGCSVVSPGCTNCYAMKMAARLEAMGTSRYAGLTKPSKAGAVWTGELRLVDDALTIPLRRRKPTTYFVNSMSDLFHESVPDAWIDRVFAVMALAPQHTFQVLTKRSARMRAYLNHEDTPHRIALACGDLMMAGHLANARGKPNRVYERTVRHPQDADGWLPATLWAWPLRSVWLGVSTEDQRRADERVPDLLATPAAVRFVSAEPLLSSIEFTPWITPAAVHHHPDNVPSPQLDALVTAARRQLAPRLDWIIVGGESGPGARPMHPAWARDIRDQCAAAGTAFHFKQHGSWVPEARGRDWMILSADGSLDIPDDRPPDEAAGEVAVTCIGKKAAGRLLDGVEHNGMPTALTGGPRP